MANHILDAVVQAAEQPLAKQCLEAGIVGLFAHAFYFIHWTTDTETLKMVVGHLIALSAVFPIEVTARGTSGGISAGFAVLGSYLGALFTSIIIYRVFFHRLRRFPGPFWARFSKFYGIYLARNWKMHEEHDLMLKKYGDLVRIGPNEILHSSIDCMTEVHGPQSKCYKNSMYQVLEYGPHRVMNIDVISDRKEHRTRRQAWDKAFSAKAVEAREEPLRQITLEWLSKVDEFQGQPLNWSLFASLINFDMTGRIGFSHDFGGLRAGKRNPIQTHIQALFKNLSTTGQVPWLISLLQRSNLPMNKDITAFEELAKTLVKERLADTEVKNDIIGYFIDDYKSEKPKTFLMTDDLETDAQALLIASANTSMVPMTYGIYSLINRPGSIEKLRAELAPVFGKTIPGGFAEKDLAHLEYLNAIIDETLRLYTATCQHGTRATPPEGIVLNNTFIPGSVSLVSSMWSFHRSEKFFVKPLEWIPERWTTEPDLIRDKRAFHPFLYGPFNCVGKRMALMFLRMVFAYTIWFCDVEYAPGEDGKKIHTQARNEVTLVPGPLFLTFKKRHVV